MILMAVGFERRNPLARIKRLAIPPAWRDVWICPDASGHLQATGRDARGRKQHRYHSDWRRIRDETKYDRVIGFGRALQKIRRRVARDLARRGLPREKVLATIVRLLETTLIRVGNEEYARDNKSYGLTTLRTAMLKSARARSPSNFAASQANNTSSISVTASSQRSSNDVAIFPATSFSNMSTSRALPWTSPPAM